MRHSSVAKTFLQAFVLLLLFGCTREAPESTPGDAGIAMDADDIAGVVRSAAGPEAGVWVIAETADLGTRFARIEIGRAHV